MIGRPFAVASTGTSIICLPTATGFVGDSFVRGDAACGGSFGLGGGSSAGTRNMACQVDALVGRLRGQTPAFVCKWGGPECFGFSLPAAR